MNRVTSAGRKSVSRFFPFGFAQGFGSITTDSVQNDAWGAFFSVILSAAKDLARRIGT